MTREEELRAMRERKFAPAKPAKTSRGGGESKPARLGQAGTARKAPRSPTGRPSAPPVQVDEAGVALGPRETPRTGTKPKGRPLDSLRHLSIEANKPWKTEVPPMSRRTWFRRRKKAGAP